MGMIVAAVTLADSYEFLCLQNFWQNWIKHTKVLLVMMIMNAVDTIVTKFGLVKILGFSFVKYPEFGLK